MTTTKTMFNGSYNESPIRIHAVSRNRVAYLLRAARSRGAEIVTGRFRSKSYEILDGMDKETRIGGLLIWEL